MSVPDPRSGIYEDGRWSPAFEGQRPPLSGEVGVATRFAEGHGLSTRHGAYVALRGDLAAAAERLGPEAVEEAALIRSLVPAYAPSDELAVQDLAIVRVRIRRANAALRGFDEATGDGREFSLYNPASGRAETFETLRRDLDRWIARSRALRNDLGLSTAARAELAETIARTQLDLTRLSNEELDALDRLVERSEVDAG